MSKKLSTLEDFKQLIADYDSWLFDCDGVIWHGNELIDGVKEVLQYLRKQGKTCIFVTNNATKSREQLKAKFDKLGLEAHVDEIFGSAYASVAYLKYNLKFPSDKKVYILGEKGMEHELDSEDVKYCGGTDPNEQRFFSPMETPDLPSDPDVGAVMCGFDANVNYYKLARAHHFLRRNEGCHFILTNDDSTFPAADGSLYPGSGAISASLRFAVPHIEPTVVGKPNKPFMDSIEKMHKLDKKRTIMVGDRLDTDILFGINGGTSSMMVLTGVNKLNDFSGPNAKIVPDFYVKSLGAMSVLADT